MSEVEEMVAFLEARKTKQLHGVMLILAFAFLFLSVGAIIHGLAAPDKTFSDLSGIVTGQKLTTEFDP